MHFLELLNTKLHYSAGIQTQRKPPNTGYEPVRYSTVAWTTRIKSRCQCSNAGHVMICNCSDTVPPISWLLRNHALSRWNNNNVALWKELKVHYIISDIKQKAWNLHLDKPYFNSCGKRDNSMLFSTTSVLYLSAMNRLSTEFWYLEIQFVWSPPHKMVTGIIVYHRTINNYRMVQRYDTSKTRMRLKEIHIILLCGSILQKTLVIRVI
jgi:hypothetical protein